MWPDLQETADLVTFTEEILNVKLHFLGIVNFYVWTMAGEDSYISQAFIFQVAFLEKSNVARPEVDFGSAQYLRWESHQWKPF